MLFFSLASHAQSQTENTKPALPSLAELEATGAVIGQIHIRPQNIFNLDDADENNALFRLANKLHVPTRPSVIESALLFQRGEKISRRKIEETERLLRASQSLYDVDINPVAYKDGVVDLEVVSRDTWTIDLTASFSRSGGESKSRFGIREGNLLGSGISIGLTRQSDADRSGHELELVYPQAFDGRTRISLLRGRFDDGKRTQFAVDRPFYSFDARFAARAAWGDEDRIDSIYNAGNVVSEYRHRLRTAELSAGWSPGLIDGWTQRFSGGGLMDDHHYRIEPGRKPLIPLPVDSDLTGAFFRYELLEDRFVRTKNHNLIERAEFLPMGFAGKLQITRSLEDEGPTKSAWLYSIGVSKGFNPAPTQTLLAAASLARRVASTGDLLTHGSVSVRWFAPQSPQSLWYAAAFADRVSGGGVADQLLIGGINGLRGYPSRYQSGEQRMLATVERRYYSNWYPFKLVRIGGAAFFDTGRAWGGGNQNTVNGGWLSDAGIGLRIALDRASFANVFHADVAFPLNRADGVKATQFSVKTELTF
ncbi:MAG: BamA/TamA family outer membrane protein [Betaproteobacteria bacterium]|nr:BamA/TamA family outer membrane protein [Betaproteobacteria bacterium]